jgi:hypothetical protein
MVVWLLWFDAAACGSEFFCHMCLVHLYSQSLMPLENNLSQTTKEKLDQKLGVGKILFVAR